jgi:polar amino acid transport system ATP-binding protein
LHWNLTALTKSYAKHQALAQLHFSTPAPLHCLALIGPSGGGKSTLLRHLGGLETPDAGRIELDGEPLPSDSNGLRQYRIRHGFLFQSYNLFPHLNVQDNIVLPLVKVQGLKETEALERCHTLSERFNLTGQLKKHPQQLSGGQQQRVALVRAAAARPRILFLDEPTAALDPEMTSEVLELIRDLRRDGQKLVLSTHEIGFAKAAADHIAFIAQGKVLEHGSPGELLRQPSDPAVRRFLDKTNLFT